MTDQGVGTLLIRGGHVWGHGPADLHLRDGVVVEVRSPGAAGADAGGDVAPPAEVVEATGHLVLPGLVEAHCHLDKTLFGRAWVPHSAGDALAERIANDRARRHELGLPDPDAMSTLVAAMSRAGTTSIRTHTDVDPEAGLRGIEAVAALAAQVSHLVDIQQVAFPQHGLISLPGTADLLDEALASGQATVVGGLDPGAEGDAAGYLDIVFSLAERHHGMVDLHLHTTGPAGLADLDLILDRSTALELGGRVVVSHAYLFGGLDERASRALAERLATAGIGVVTAAPYSFPVPPLDVLAASGVTCGIGHDGIRDLWGPYGTGDLLERARHVAYRSTFRRDEQIEVVLDAACRGGRAALGLPDPLSPTGPADLVLVPAAAGAEAVVIAPPERIVIKHGVRLP